MPATKKGVYHNLKESIYTASNGEAVLFFSSEFYLKKFMIGYRDHRVQFSNKMKRIAPNNQLNLNVFADIQYYYQIEKRGFNAWLEGVSVSCRDLERYVLRARTKKHTPDWQRIQRPKLGERLRTMESI